jgi:hypothetical protein
MRRPGDVGLKGEKGIAIMKKECLGHLGVNGIAVLKLTLSK